MSNLSKVVKGIELGDFLFEPAIMDKTLRQMAAGSLEIETGTQAADFDAIVLNTPCLIISVQPQ
ncbi:hypothetical protein BSPWISOXPB_10542 [uncultured Gammaproteobacteria bacterium]|nr:hypothetical protein BSPWISOXPB_10542 [uncultured Gammaproteobacteria bacterium]